MPKIDRLTAIQMRREGKRLQEIADHFGATRQAVSALLLHTPSRVSAVNRNHVLRLHAAGHSVAEIARDIGCTESTIAKIVRRVSDRKRKVIDRDRVRSLRQQGKLIREIAEELDAHPNNISRILKELGLTQRPPKVDVHDVFRMRSEGNSIMAIADTLGVHVTTIHRAIKMHRQNGAASEKGGVLPHHIPTGGRGRQSARQLLLLRYLAQDGSWVPSSELMESVYGGAYRTMYRDLRQLQSIGVPIEWDESKDRGWRLRRGPLLEWLGFERATA